MNPSGVVAASTTSDGLIRATTSTRSSTGVLAPRKLTRQPLRWSTTPNTIRATSCNSPGGQASTACGPSPWPHPRAALVNMLEGLRAAVGRRGLSVTTVCPGFVRTDLTEHNDFPMPFMVEPEHAANAICDGLERGRMEIVFPLPMAILMKAARLLPVRAWARLTTRAANR